MRPSDDSWRADALARSRHTRWLDELRQPLADCDPEQAETICGAVTRAALRDFAPAIMLLSAVERRRARALGAYALTLFDFAAQAGLEGERLSQINRLEFDLESALAGASSGQPIFVLMEGGSPWPTEALDALATAARHRATRPRPETGDEADRESRHLGRALATALTGDRAPGAARLAAGLLRLGGLLTLAEDSRRHRPQLPRQVLPDDWLRGAGKGATLERAIRDECGAIAELLTDIDLAGLSPTERRAARYLRTAARRLLRRAERRGADLLDGPPELGALTRLGLLARSFLG